MGTNGSLLDLASRFAANEAELAELDAFLTEEADSLSARADDDLVAQLAGLIDVSLAEIDQGVTSEDDLRARLTEFFLHRALWWSPAAVDGLIIESGSANRTSEITSGPQTAVHTAA